MKKFLKIVFYVLLTIVLITGIYIVTHTRNDVVVTKYQLDAKIKNSMRIVQLTDLHNAEFGEDNSELVQLVREQKPDFIVLTGDMANKDEEDISIACNLVKQLSGIAKVFYCYGNAEKSWEKNYQRNFGEAIKKSGGIVLDRNFEDVEVKGNELRIGGYMGYYNAPHMSEKTPEEQQKTADFESSFEDTSRYKILLDHIPTTWVDWEHLDDFSIDLVFSGHYHGGMIQFPITGRGLYVPYIGWFPDKLKGVFQGKNAACVLSSGLGSEYPIPRVNNAPEIVVVDLEPDNK